MKKSSVKPQVPARLFEASALCILVFSLGALYYGVYRHHPVLNLIPGFHYLSAALNSAVPLGQDVNWFPSFAHAFVTLLVLSCLLYKQARYVQQGSSFIVLLCLLLMECLFGVVDLFDFGGILVGAICANYAAKSFYVITEAPDIKQVTGSGFSLKTLTLSNRNSLMLPSLVVVSGLFASGSIYWGTPTDGTSWSECARFESGTCIEEVQYASPVYMTYQELRESVRLEAARTPENLGRVYLYEQYVLLNEVNQGIHIFDNSDPVVPVNLGFINVPGNTDIAVRDNYLYADSYVDLVTLDLNDPANVSEVSRQEFMFPYDAHQNIPYNIRLSLGTVSASNGVVVSYRLSGN